MPIKRKNFLVGCRCRWKIDEQEICHWRRAKTNKIYDEEIQNWYCAQREAVSFELAPAGLPPNLKYCKAVTRFSQRIFGGMQTSLERWPWIVRIEFGNRRCGGTLISESKVLTAAHCCSGFENDLKNVRIYLNEEDALLFEENEIIRNPVMLKIHENYRTNAFHDDLCVLHFQPPKSSSNQPVCLPDSSTLAPSISSKCFIAGWGKTSFSPHEEANHKLNEVDVKIWNNAKCRNALSSENLDLTKMLCAGWKEGVKDSCQGDSGGPLVCVQDQRAILFGVTSWGVGCGMPDSPGVYVRIMHYLPWLNKI
jgi:secreted trypsin-like serine protease